MSGTKRMFEMTERIKELEYSGHYEKEIVEIIGDEFNMELYLAEAIVESYFDNKVAKNFSWDGDTNYGS